MGSNSRELAYLAGRVVLVDATLQPAGWDLGHKWLIFSLCQESWPRIFHLLGLGAILLQPALHGGLTSQTL